MESLVHHPTDPQSELLKRYCTEAELLLKTAASADEAHRLGDQMCAKLAFECSSPLVVRATRLYMDDIIRRMFESNPGTHREDHPTHNDH